MKEINALRLIKVLVEKSPTSEVMDEQSKDELLKLINHKIRIETCIL